MLLQTCAHSHKHMRLQTRTRSKCICMLKVNPEKNYVKSRSIGICSRAYVIRQSLQSAENKSEKIKKNKNMNKKNAWDKRE